MGLDMYTYTRAGSLSASVDFDSEQDDAQLHYWRKHPNLHGWMTQLYREKGGTADDFNCVNLQLTESDIDRLEADLRAGNLPSTSGFFFGETDGSEFADDLEFIRKARDTLRGGRAVYYTSWW